MAGRHLTARASNPRRVVTALLTAVAIAAAWVAVGVTGTGGTFAAWSSSVTLPGATLHTGSAGLRLDGFDQLGATFTSTSLSDGPNVVSVVNTGATTLKSFTTAASITGSTALAAAVKVAIWPRTGSSCGTQPTSAKTGTWSSMPSWLQGQGPLAAGAAAAYCVTSSITSTALSQSAGQTVTPTVTVAGWTGATTGTGWTTGAQSSPAFTIAANAGWVTVSPSQVGITAGNNTSVAVREQVGGHDSTSTPGYICLDIRVTPIGRNNDSWTLVVDTTKAPFKADPDRSDWDVVANDGGSIRYSTGRNTVTLNGTSRSTQEFQICLNQGSSSS